MSDRTTPMRAPNLIISLVRLATAAGGRAIIVPLAKPYRIATTSKDGREVTPSQLNTRMLEHRMAGV